MAVLFEDGENIGWKTQNVKFALTSLHSDIELSVDKDGTVVFRGLGCTDFRQCSPVVENTLDQYLDFPAGGLDAEETGFQYPGIVEYQQIVLVQIIDQMVEM